jgi:hypothetical protein
MAAQPTDGVIAVYTSMDEVDSALRKLADEGIPTESMSIITQNLESTTKVHGFVSTGDVAATGAGWGAWTGGLFGLLAGVALIIVPGVGPVLAGGSIATWVLGALEGAGGGAALGGLLGAGIGTFVKREHIPKYEHELRAGKYLLIAHGESDIVDRAQKVLDATGVSDLQRCTA